MKNGTMSTPATPAGAVARRSRRPLGKMRPAAALLALALSGLATGCATGPDFSGPRPGEKWRVSTQTLPLRQKPDGLSPSTKVLKYGDSVLIRKDVRVAPAFTGDRDKFPEDLIPCWVEVSAQNAATGFVPVPSLASEWLSENQDPEESISDEGMSVARRGFSESETDEELASMRGAAGAGSVAAKADPEAVEEALRTRIEVSDEEVSEFLRAGGLAGREVPPEVLEIEERGAFSEFLVSARQNVSQGIGWVADKVSGDAGGPLGGSDGKLVAAAGKTASGLLYSEIGPVQEFQMGKVVAARIFPLYKAVDTADPRARYVAEVGASLARASNDPMPYGGYLFALVDSDEVNAFAVPGGFVFVTTGMLDFLQDEDELAAILGHEMGHEELRHGSKSVGTERILRLLSMLKDAGLSEGGAQAGAGTAELKQWIDELFGEMLDSVRNGYGVEIESQADWRSLQLCARLGYDTMALHEVLERFKTVKGSYGGASYPEERGADVLRYREQLGFGSETAPAPGRDLRAKRYEASVRR